MRTTLALLAAVLLSACTVGYEPGNLELPKINLTFDAGYQYDGQGNYMCNTHVDCYDPYGYNNTGYATDGNIQGLQGCQDSGYGGGPMDCIVNGRHQWVNTNQIRVDNGGQSQQINRRLQQ